LTISNLPSLTFRGKESRGHAPRNLADSALYDGILWRRVGAYFIDAVLILGVNLALHVFLLFAGLLTFGLSWLLLGPVTCLTVALGYDTLFIGGGQGATPGMRLFGLEARGLDGGRPEYFLHRTQPHGPRFPVRHHHRPPRPLKGGLNHRSGAKGLARGASSLP
jgi:hypothetical protein